VKLQLEWISLRLGYWWWAENVGTEERMHREICRRKTIRQNGHFEIQGTFFKIPIRLILPQDSVPEAIEKIPLLYQGNTREGDAV
jgi:hypothetical protein